MHVVAREQRAAPFEERGHDILHACLLDVDVPLGYGRGSRALERLQHEITRHPRRSSHLLLEVERWWTWAPTVKILSPFNCRVQKPPDPAARWQAGAPMEKPSPFATTNSVLHIQAFCSALLLTLNRDAGEELAEHRPMPQRLGIHISGNEVTGRTPREGGLRTSEKLPQDPRMR